LYMAITAMPAYQNYSFEELRVQDYDLNLVNLVNLVDLEEDTMTGQINAVRFIPSQGPQAWDCSQDKPFERETSLQAARELLPFSARTVVWAVESTANNDWRLPAFCSMEFRALLPVSIVKQIQKLSSFASSGQASKCLVEHLFEACIKLSEMVQDWSQVQDSSGTQAALQELRNVSWVPVSHEGKYCLLPPSRVARQSDRKLEPILGVLPEKWRTESRLTKFLKAVGIENRFSVDVLTHQLQTMADEYPLSQGSMSFAISLSCEIACHFKDHGSTNKNTQLCVPTASGRLLPVGEVSINDANWIKGDQPVLLHDEISAQFGRLLGCGSIRERMARSCEADGDEFGQHEDLVVRIRSILAQYHDDDDVFAEHFQNCDDAGASEVVFVLDQRMHASEHLVNDRAKIMQGPALLLTSSQELKDRDIERMTRLGDSEKRSDFSKCGRFGLGLNCFYRVTDTIQLLANGHLYILDPMQKAVAKEGGRGCHYKCIMLEKNFPEMLIPFADFAKYPTVFRLPLRTAASPEIDQKSYSVHDVTKMMNTLIRKAETLLVLSKFVSRIRVEVIAEAAEPQVWLDLEKLPGDVETGHPEGPLSIMKRLPRTIDEVIALKDSPIETVATVNILGSDLHHGWDSEWLLSHSLCANEKMLELVEKLLHPAVKDTAGTAMLPHGATALRIKTTRGREEGGGHVCCYLPLNNLPIFGPDSGRAISIHGCFNVTDSRKSIPMPVAGQPTSTAKQWNEELLRGPVAISYRNLLLFHRRAVTDDESVQSWYSLLGLHTDARNQSSVQIREVLRDEVIRLMLKEKDPILPVLGAQARPEWKCAPLPIRPDGAGGRLGKELEDLLISAGLDLATLPETLQPIFQKVNPDLTWKYLTPSELCSFLKTDAGAHSQALARPDNVSRLLCFVVAGCAAKDFLTFGIIGHQKQRLDDLSILIGVPLLVCSSGEVCRFGEQAVFWSKSELLPMVPGNFISEDTRRILRDESTSLEDLLDACKPLTIRRLEPCDLLKYKIVIHDDGLVRCKKWQKSFWSLMWETCREKKSAKKTDTVFSEFGDWEILKVCSLNGEGFSLRQLSEIKHTFSLHNTNVEWRKDVAEILRECGVNILYCTPDPDHQNELDLIKELGVHNGDDSFLELLRRYFGAARSCSKDNLSVIGRVKCLEYFAKRKQLLPKTLGAIKALPLFLAAARPHLPMQKHFVPIDDHEVQYNCLYGEDKLKARADAIMNLAIPGVFFLAMPTEKMKSLYLQLGVKIREASEFMAADVAKIMPKIAREGYPKINPFLKELEAWQREPEPFERILKAFKQSSFVYTMASGYLSPEELLSPGSGLAESFRTTLETKLPSAEYQSHSKLLEQLGMKKSVSAELILKCAENLDEFAGSIPVGEEIPQEWKKASYNLVESLCRVLGQRWTDDQKDDLNMQQGKRLTNGEGNILLTAARRRILLVSGHHPTTKSDDDDSSAQTRVQQRAIRTGNFKQEMDLGASKGGGQLRLSGMRGVALPQCANLAWTSLPIVEHDAMNPKPKTQSTLQWLAANFHPKLTDMEVYATQDTLPLNVLTAQLNSLSRAAARLPAPSRFQASSLLASDIKLLHDMIHQRLKQDPSQSQALAQLKSIPCIYKHLQEDASGPLPDGGSLMLVRPDHAFERLPEVARGQDLFHEVANEHHAVFKALGVRESPSIEDWALFTREVYEDAKASKATSLLDRDERAIEAAVRSVAKLLENKSLQQKYLESSQSLELFLVDEHKQICSSKKLLFLDKPVWKERCTKFCKEHGLSFVQIGLLERHMDELNLLCKITSLRKLSDCVSECLCKMCEVDTVLATASAHELKLDEVVRSAEFAHCICAIMYWSLETNLKPAKVHKVLNSVKIKWVPELYTELVINGDKLTDSESETCAFFMDTTLWVKSALLDSGEHDTTQSFLRRTAEQISSILHHNGILASFREHYIVEMLEHWKKGPQILLREFASKNPAFFALLAVEILGKDQRNSLRNSPGMCVPLDQHSLLIQNMLCSFEVGELVAVADGSKDGIAAYLFARVSTREGLTKTDEAQAASGECTRRMYAVDCGSESLQQLSHFDLYKIDRTYKSDGSPHRQPQVEEGLQRNEGIPAEPQICNSKESDWRDLVSLLKQMETMPECNYKKCLKRLFLEWHPDKCRDKAHARDFFMVLRQHEATYKGDKDFSWLSDTGVTNIDDAADFCHHSMPDEADGGGVPTNSWLDEFEREKLREGEAMSHWQRAQAQHAGFAAISQPPADARELNRNMADKYYTSAKYWQEGARINFKSGRWANSVWDAQQVCEFAIKGVMLGTCGLTEEQKKGVGAHDLVLHVCDP